MPYSLACADTGTGCPASFTTETDQELMEHVELHATRAHPDMKLNDETVGQIKGLVRQS